MNYSINSLSDIAIEYIKDQILSARLKSGAKIVEAEIAESLQISRAPVREALRSLSHQGIVTFSPRRGHYVLEMTREELFEVFQIRISLELQILKILVSDRILGPADYDHLTHLSQQMQSADTQATDEHQRIFLLNTLDIRFHRYLWGLSKSTRRARLLEDHFLQLLVMMNQNVASLGSCEEKSSEHLELIKALGTNNADQVCAELRRHLDKYILAALGDLSDHEAQTLEILFRA